MTQRIAVFPADRHSLYEEHGYSAAIRSGDLLFVSGQVGSHTDGTPEPDFQKQVRILMSMRTPTAKLSPRSTSGVFCLFSCLSAFTPPVPRL